MITKANTTVPPLNLFGKNVDVPYRVTLLDYTYTEEEAKQLGRGYDNFETTRPYNSNYKDLMGVLEDNGKTLKLSSRSKPVIGSFDVTTDRGRKDAEAAIKTWHDSVMARGDHKFLADKSKIQGDLGSEDSPPADKPASASSDATEPTGEFNWNNIPKDFGTKFPGIGSYSIFDTKPGSSAKTVKHPSTFRGITLKMGEKVEVKDLSGVFGSKNGKVCVELTEKGYIVSSPALDKQYRVNVNSPKSSQVILQLEKTVLRAEKEVQQRMSSNEQQSWDAINGYSS